MRPLESAFPGPRKNSLPFASTTFCERFAMRVRTGIVVATIAAALCCGLIARGQNREKNLEGMKKAPDAGKKPAADAARKSTDAGKKASDAGKAAAVKAPQARAPAEGADEKTIRASAETFTKLYNAHDAKGLAALFAPKAEMIDEDDQVVKGREPIENAFADVL